MVSSVSLPPATQRLDSIGGEKGSSTGSMEVDKQLGDVLKASKRGAEGDGDKNTAIAKMEDSLRQALGDNKDPDKVEKEIDALRQALQKTGTDGNLNNLSADDKKIIDDAGTKIANDVNARQPVSTTPLTSTKDPKDTNLI